MQRGDNDKAATIARRRFLEQLAAFANAAIVGNALPSPAKGDDSPRTQWKRQIRIGLHQAGWSARKIRSFFEAARKLRYDGVELAPPWLEQFHPLEDVCGMLDDFNLLLAPAIFVGGQELRDPTRETAYCEKASRWAKWIKNRGGRYVIYSTVAGTGPRRTADETKQVAKAFDRVATAVTAEGCTPLYHNHYVKSSSESKRLLEKDLGLLDWNHWRLCVDTGHLVLAKTDPVEFVEQWRDKIAWMHCKDVKRHAVQVVDQPGVRWQDQFTRLGSGVVDFSKVVALLADSQYDGWLIVEQDRSPDLYRSAKESRAYLLGVIDSL
ncbi:MAG: sugar phosphate isomerase/epimerase [Planctomycetes bacterium]|nr:sugar phosphate isomerase/epimerase [Planctomycetota bacterium]